MESRMEKVKAFSISLSNPELLVIVPKKQFVYVTDS